MIRNFSRSIILFLFVSVLFLSSISQAGVISPDLQFLIQSSAPDEEISVIITLSDQTDLRPLKEEKDKFIRRTKITKELKDNANRTQGPLKAFLQGRGVKRMIPFWIFNGIAATVRVSAIVEIANFPLVESITPDYVVEAPQVTVTAAAPPEWNISAIKAPDLWDIGFTGVGVVVANADSGVDILHPDLNGKWRGGTNSWFNPFSDPANSVYCATPNNCTPCELNSLTPCDSVGHGTGTMGIMVGGSAGGTAIGVAPDAKWIAVKVLNDARSGASSIILQGFQWILGLPPDEAPDVVNNSWGFPNVNGCNISFQSSITTMKAAGIEVVFSAGNSGPSPSTSVSPANNSGTFAVGATDINNAIASFSSRGPSACDASIFPHVVAPGVNVRTTTPANSYTNLSGTSFSAPHVAGAMALLLSALPTLTPRQMELSLKETALDLGTAGPDNDYGYGLIDVNKAYNLLSNPSSDSPAIAWNPTANRLHILMKETNNRVYETTVDSSMGSFGGWAQFLNGRTPSAPAIAWDSTDSKFFIAARGMDNRIYLGTMTSTGAFNNDWTALPTGTTPSSPAISWNPTDNKLYIAVRGGVDNSVYCATVSSSMGVFSGWTRLTPGTTPSAPAISWNDTNKILHIFVEGFNNKIYGATVNSSIGAFSGWTALPVGTTPSSPAIAWDSTDSKLHIVVRGRENNRIYGTSVDSTMGSFSGWIVLPTGTTLLSPSIAWNPTANQLHIVVTGQDNFLYGTTVNSLMGSFSGWRIL